jgi:hypothetical protein
LDTGRETWYKWWTRLSNTFGEPKARMRHVSDKRRPQVTTHEQVDSLLAALDKTVEGVLAYFEGPGSTSKARVGEWGAWEVLCHFVFWHEATIQGMESVARGGASSQLDVGVDDLNARVIAENQGKGFLDLTARLRELQGQLQRAARSLPDLDSPVMVHADGKMLSGRERLEIMNRHWGEHLAELQVAEPS